LSVAALIEKYDARVPRYTSYPTAPHFTAAVNEPAYRSWLAALPEGAALSLYLHIPFCAQLCWFCGCHTTAVNHVAPLLSYAETLLAEIDLLAGAIGRRMKVAHVHWGGGSPTAMPAPQLRQIMARLRERFDFGPDAEIAFEIDPRTATPEVLDAMRDVGCTRASLGVQDFDPAVQRAVNRHQSYETTAACAEGLRARGVGSINLDLIYGLPHQTVAGVAATVDRALDIAPDRVAVFGYAHVPWMKKHQTLIDEAVLPGAMERWRQELAASEAILARGYRRVGLDHYALASDALARAAEAATLHRNFQGYTTDDAPVLLGLGASSIGSLPQGYVQNIPGVAAWRDAVREGHLPIARGIALTDDDRLRGDVIETLMCQGSVSLGAVAARHGADPAPLRDAAAALKSFAADQLIDWDGETVTMRADAGPFVRSVAACFDAYLRPGEQRHSRAV